MTSPVVVYRNNYLERPYLDAGDPYLAGEADYGYGLQVQLVAYNTTQTRFMWVFPSRGIPDDLGNNWTATNQATGDFAPSNVNTDVEEEVFRSAGTTVSLVCDTGLNQSVAIDTAAVRAHNLTVDATILFEGSNDPTFATTNYSFAMTTTAPHAYYIAPTFPVEAAKSNRYWRVTITDATNPDGYVEIGMIVFGVARLFSTDDDFVNPLKRGSRHFKDALPTEGFTSYSNDRALKRHLRLGFEMMHRINGGVGLLEEMTDYCRTSLKILCIPRPAFPSRYSVYAKLSGMPEFDDVDHSNNASPDGQEVYCSTALDFDESL